MSPEEQALLSALVEGQKVLTETLRSLSERVMELSGQNLVLTTACGALYGELAKVVGKPGTLDELLSRVMGIIEGNAVSTQGALKAADDIREFAELVARQ